MGVSSRFCKEFLTPEGRKDVNGLEDSIHQGHRQRVRERFLQTGLNGFQEHQILEFLLFYAIPRADTNPLAHRLLRRFGSLNEVLAASIPALRSVEGMTENAAIYLRLIASVYAASPDKTYAQVPMNNPASICAYFQRIYAYENREVLRLACLDEQFFLRNCHILEVGTTRSVTVSIRKIVEHAIFDNSSILILAHNHPNSTAQVSREDISSTEQIMGYLKTLSIELFDHIIVGQDNVISMRDTGCLL